MTTEEERSPSTWNSTIAGTDPFGGVYVYVLYLQDDGRQGRPGGLERYAVVLDTSTGKVSGLGFSVEFLHFVIERKEF